MDELLNEYRSHESRIAEIGAEIESTGQERAVVFVDLVGSTALKAFPTRVWLGQLQQFVLVVSSLAEQYGGIVAKRSGDGVLATFETAIASESFLDELVEKVSPSFGFRGAADYGSVYHLKFSPGSNGDPYGGPVDRCARLADMAEGGVIVCSSSYAEQVPDEARYVELGSFALKGLTQPQVVYLRSDSASVTTEQYLRPLLLSLQQGEGEFVGYRQVPRTFTPEEFRDSLADSHAKPFLLRELVRLPRLPFDAVAFRQHRESKQEEEWLQYHGYLVDWTGSFDGYKRYPGNSIVATMDHTPRGTFASTFTFLNMPIWAKESLDMLSRGANIRCRGVIQEIRRSHVTLNYVELWVPNSSSGDQHS